MADLTDNSCCLICSSVLASTTNKVNKLDVIFLLRMLLEIPQDSQLINDAKLTLHLNDFHVCDQCNRTIKQCKQIYSGICKQVEKFWIGQTKIFEKFVSSKPFQNIKTDEERTSDRTKYSCWADRCRNFVKDNDFSRFGYPFVVQDLETLVVPLPQTGTGDRANVKTEHHKSTKCNDNEEDIDSFYYDPPASVNGDGYSDIDEDFTPSPSKKSRILDNGKSNNEVPLGGGALGTKKLEIRLNRLTTGHFTCNWPGCNDGQGKNFKIKECWEDHMITHKKPGNIPEVPQAYLCVWPNCDEGKGKEFKTKESWEVHMDRHQRTPRKKCEECGLIFYSKEQLNFHVKLEHGKGRKSRRLAKGSLVESKDDDDELNVDNEGLDSKKKSDDMDEDFQVDGEDDPGGLSSEDNSDSELESSKKPRRKGRKNKTIWNDKEDISKAFYICSWPNCNNGKGKRFRSKVQFETHMDRHNGTPKRNCDKCDLLFYSYYDLYLHLKDVHKVVKKKKKKLDSKFNYKLKEDPVTGKYHCTWPGCEKDFTVLDHIRTHLDRHNGTPRRECDYDQCGKMFYSWPQLQRHRQREHSNGERNFGCEICGRRYFTAADLADHKARKHSSSSGYVVNKWAICETCGKRMRRLHLAIHVRTVHEGVKTVKKWGCHLCPGAYKMEMQLKLHLWKGHGILGSEEEKEEIERWVERRTELGKKWRCPVKRCWTGCITEEGLKRHVEEKHGGNWGDGEGDLFKFRCENCGKGFHHKTRYTEHMEKYKKEEDKVKPFSCEVCGKGFPKMSVVRKHMKTHEVKERKWGCEVCKVGFVDEKGLEKHREGKSHKLRVKIVEGDGRRECELCGKMFKWASNLSQHRRKVHNGLGGRKKNGVTGSGDIKDVKMEMM